MLKVTVLSRTNAGKAVKSRWGLVQFDATGIAALEVADEDLGRLGQLGWVVQDAAGASAPEPKPEPKPEPALEPEPAPVPKAEAAPEPVPTKKKKKRNKQ